MENSQQLSGSGRIIVSVPIRVQIANPHQHAVGKECVGQVILAQLASAIATCTRSGRNNGVDLKDTSKHLFGVIPPWA